MMEVQNEEDSIFTRDHIKYWEGQFTKDEETGLTYVIPVGDDPKPCNIFVGVDPATDSARRNSDFSVLIVIAVTPDNNVYVLDYIRKQSIPVLGIPGENKMGIVDYMFQYAKTYKPSLFTVEDTTMSKPVFQAIRAEMRRRNEFIIPFKEEKPGNRMSKRDRIQEILAQRFAVGQIHIKKNQYELQHEIITFGPRMGHDDTIDALAYACKYAHTPTHVGERKGECYKKKPKAKDWAVA